MPNIINTPPLKNHKSILNNLYLFVAYRKFIVYVTLAGCLCALMISLLLPNIYTAKSLILPPQQDQNMMGAMFANMGGLAGMAGDFMTSGSKTDIYVGILKSDAIKDPIIDQFHLQKIYAQKYRVTTYNALNNHVSITSGKKDGIISINVEDKDPKLATDIANAYVKELEKILVRMSITDADQTKSYISTRLADARADLARTEEAVKAFQIKNQALDISEQTKGSIKVIADLRAQLLANEVQLAVLRRQFTDSNHEVEKVLVSIRNLKSQIAKMEGTGTVSSIPSVGSVPAIGQEYLRLMRDFKIQETLVELLTKQYEMNSLAEHKNTANIQIIQSARIPDRKTKPKRFFIVISATMASFMTALLLVLLHNNYGNLSDEQMAFWTELKRSLFMRKN